MRKVLIVGAGGFTGGFIVAEALRRGFEVWAGVRASTSRKWLDDPRIRFVVFDFDNPASIAATLKEALPQGERWEWIVYNLGATKVTSYADFNRINYEYLRYFTESLKETGMVPDRFLYISSLSAMGPGDERGYAPFVETMPPRPNTRYGASKLKAEMQLTMSGIPYIILRPTGVYGPRDHDYFLMFKSMEKGFDFSVGYRRQLLTFLYVGDLARAVFDALEKAPCGETYILSEPRAYTQREFRHMAAAEMGLRFVIPVRMPLWGVKAVSWVAEKWGVARNRPSTLNSDKYRIMKQRNWNAAIGKAQRDFGFRPEVDLREGMHRTIEWYKKEKWL